MYFLHCYDTITMSTFTYLIYFTELTIKNLKKTDIKNIKLKPFYKLITYYIFVICSLTTCQMTFHLSSILMMLFSLH